MAGKTRAFTMDSYADEEEEAMACVPSAKTNNLLTENSGTEEEELTLTMEWKTGLGGRVGISVPGYKGSTFLKGDYEGIVISHVSEGSLQAGLEC